MRKYHCDVCDVVTRYLIRIIEVDCEYLTPDMTGVALGEVCLSCLWAGLDKTDAAPMSNEPRLRRLGK